MSTEGNRGPRPVEESDWRGARQAMSRLAAAHHSVVPNLEAGRASNEAVGVSRLQGGADTVAVSMRPIAPIDRGQLARAVAEIAEASAALRRLQPALELCRPGSQADGETRKHLPVWILIGGIWISAIVVCSAAIGAIFYLFD